MSTESISRPTQRVKAKIPQAFTSEVYGDPKVHSPQTSGEDDWGNVNPIGTRSCYDEGERRAEQQLADARTAIPRRMRPEFFACAA